MDKNAALSFEDYLKDTAEKRDRLGIPHEPIESAEKNYDRYVALVNDFGPCDIVYEKDDNGFYVECYAQRRKNYLPAPKI
jgi:hypothetical protein